MIEVLFPPDAVGQLAVIRGYFDESYKEKGIYAIGGYVGRDKDWRPMSQQWRNRRLRDGIEVFHAADCEHGFNEFESLSKPERTQLKADLIQIVSSSGISIGGFASAVVMDDFAKVRNSSDRAKKVLGPDPYFLCFQTLCSDVCESVQAIADGHPGLRVAYIFEEQEEFSGRAKKLYDQFKAANPSYSPYMGSLAYASKGTFVPLEIADNIAYESMKEILNNKFDPTRPRRIAMEKMKSKIRRISLWTEETLVRLVEIGKTAEELGL